MKLKIHFHSDCRFFAGCENMLVNLWASPDLRQKYEVSFSYRVSEAYTDGLNKRTNVDFPVYPLVLPEPSVLGERVPKLSGGIGKFFKVVLRELLEFPIFLYDIFILSRLFRQIRPQILHINNGGYPGALSCRAAVIAARISGVQNILMVVNNLAIPYLSYKRRLDWPVDYLLVQCTNKFVTGSQAAGVRLQEVLKLLPEQVVSLHNGIAQRKPTESVDETRNRLGLKAFGGVVFGVVALMEKRKGHQILLQALLSLRVSEPGVMSKIMVLFEGNGPLKNELEAFVLKNDLANCVRFVGVEKNVFNFIQMLDVLVLPSIENEDFPNVVLEAMSLKKPVIASRLAGTPEQVVDGATGLLVPPKDSVALARALVKVASSSELRNDFGVKAYSRFQDCFTDEKSVSRYLNLYQEMIGG